MKARDITVISVMSATAAAIAYGDGLATSFMPGVIEFTSVIIFVNGFCFGYFVGSAIGALAMMMMLIVPFPFAHPAAWIFTISPILLAQYKKAALKFFQRNSEALSFPLVMALIFPAAVSSALARVIDEKESFCFDTYSPVL